MLLFVLNESIACGKPESFCPALIVLCGNAGKETLSAPKDARKFISIWFLNCSKCSKLWKLVELPLFCPSKLLLATICANCWAIWGLLAIFWNSPKGILEFSAKGCPGRWTSKFPDFEFLTKLISPPLVCIVVIVFGCIFWSDKMLFCWVLSVLIAGTNPESFCSAFKVIWICSALNLSSLFVILLL